MNLKSKADEVVEKGRAQRGEWTASGKPLENYIWWANETGESTDPSYLNFCKFWRIAAIYAPARKFEKQYNKLPLWLGIAIPITFVVAVLLLLGALITWIIPVAIGIVLGAVAVILGIVAGLAYVTENTRLGKWCQRHSDGIGLTLLGIPLGTLAVIMCAALYSAAGWWFPLWILGVIVGLGLIGLGITFIVQVAGPKVEAHRLKKNSEPEPTVVVETTPKGPGIIKRFFTGVGDFVILFAQVIRVKKWKYLCPMVKVDKPL